MSKCKFNDKFLNSYYVHSNKNIYPMIMDLNFVIYKCYSGAGDEKRQILHLLRRTILRKTNNCKRNLKRMKEKKVMKKYVKIQCYTLTFTATITFL